MLTIATPLILAVTAYNSKTSSILDPVFIIG